MGIIIETKGQTTVVWLNGLLNPLVCEQLSRLFANVATPAVAINCDRITAVEKNVVIELVKVAHALHARRHRVALYNVSPSLSKELGQLNCGMYLQWYQNETEVLRALAQE